MRLGILECIQVSLCLSSSTFNQSLQGSNLIVISTLLGISDFGISLNLSLQVVEILGVLTLRRGTSKQQIVEATLVRIGLQHISLSLSEVDTLQSTLQIVHVACLSHRSHCSTLQFVDDILVLSNLSSLQFLCLHSILDEGQDIINGVCNILQRITLLRLILNSINIVLEGSLLSICQILVITNDFLLLGNLLLQAKYCKSS